MTPVRYYAVAFHQGRRRRPDLYLEGEYLRDAAEAACRIVTRENQAIRAPRHGGWQVGNRRLKRDDFVRAVVWDAAGGELVRAVGHVTPAGTYYGYRDATDELVGRRRRR